jgi:hypothetical protein
MGTKQVDGKIAEVTLVRPGIETETVVLPEGSTLADLLRQASVEMDHSEVLIDEKSMAEHLVLKTGMTIRIVPEPKGGDETEPWRETIGMFKDDPAFEEMMKAVWAAREAEREAGHGEP